MTANQKLDIYNNTSIYYYAEEIDSILKKEGDDSFRKKPEFKNQREIWALIHSVMTYQLTKYSIDDGYIHNKENSDLPDFEIKKGSMEIPKGYYEMTEICEWKDGKFKSFSRNEFLEKIQLAYEKKSAKNYNFPQGVKGIILVAYKSSVKGLKLGDIPLFLHKNRFNMKFDIIIFTANLSVNDDRFLIYSYHKKSKIVFIIEILVKGETFCIKRDEQIDLTN